MTTAIIGAGIAGLSTAAEMKSAGRKIRVFDKGRGPGGRLSTRRAQTPLGEIRWDHGAQYFTAHSDAFQDEIARLRAAGAVTRWRPRLADIRRGRDGWTLGVQPSNPEEKALFVGTPAMNSVIKALAGSLDVEWGRRVSEIKCGAEGKFLIFEDGSEEGPFEHVISAVPAEQAAELLIGTSDRLAGEAAAAHSAPCWAVMLAFGAAVPVNWDAARVSGNAISWAARNQSKPDRGSHESWVLHASTDWSRAHTGMSREDVADRLSHEFLDMSGMRAGPVHVSAHRWLYAKVEQAAETLYGWDPQTGIAAVGDWRSGPRVEAAWLSGRACGKFLVRIV
ncbi:FAD-dependent oxidoreductase [Henriciella sp.]|uniref:NAD(P)/FAD-dependent oxidoreductase n=1 Tax=Henriciella sp. TaxID=1968823 RepID=UPI00261598DB|nr:FAD-dependent oxidoreductase [Henriciella sp.]